MRQQINFFASAFMLMLCGFMALVAYLFFAGSVGWISPLWEGGDALFALSFGGAAVLVSALPLNALARLIFRLANRTFTSLTAIVVGLALGMTLIPVQSAIAPSVTSFRLWQSIEPVIGIFILLGIAAIISTILGSAVAILLASRSAGSP
jgi:hypothetical protein